MSDSTESGPWRPEVIRSEGEFPYAAYAAIKVPHFPDHYVLSGKFKDEAAAEAESRDFAKLLNDYELQPKHFPKKN